MDYLQIEGKHIAVTPEWRRTIEARVADLHPGHDDVTHVRVTLAKQDHKRAEDSCEVLVVVQVPRHTLTARKQAASFEEAIRDAFSAMDIELEKLSQKRGTHEVRITAPPQRGIVNKLFRDEGYGFIALENGTEVYFHRNAVHDIAFEEMEDGMEVSLNVEPGKNGPQATTVNRVPSIVQRYADKGSLA
jgi:ribosomal subunit interface protein